MHAVDLSSHALTSSLLGAYRIGPSLRCFVYPWLAGEGPHVPSSPPPPFSAPCITPPSVSRSSQNLVVCNNQDTSFAASFQLTNYQPGDMVTDITLGQGSSRASILSSCAFRAGAGGVSITCPRSLLGMSTTQDTNLTVAVARASDTSCSTSASLTIQLRCCSSSTGSGSAYARSSIAGAAKCFRSALGCGNWGFFNAPRQGEFTESARSILGAGNRDCGGGKDVGEVVAMCSTSARMLTLAVKNTPGPASTTNPAAYDRHFFVSCNNPTRCNPPRFGASSAAVSTTQGDAATMTLGSSLGGTWPSAAAGGYYGTLKVNLGPFCSCSNVKWIVHQSGPAFYTMADSSCATAPPPSLAGESVY